jgi:hypothetical protein
MTHRIAAYLRRNHLALIALFFALSGGVAWGLTANRVTSRTIKNGTIKGVDVKDNGLTGTQIKESSLSGVLRCPAGMIGTADICYQNTDQASQEQGTAIGNCAALGLRLPSLPEALLMVDDLATPSVENDYWSSDNGEKDSGQEGRGVFKDPTGDSGIFGAQPTSLFKYRCVISPGA